MDQLSLERSAARGDARLGRSRRLTARLSRACRSPRAFITFRAADAPFDEDDDDRPLAGQLVIALGGHPAPLLGRSGQVIPVGAQGGILGMVEPTITDVVVDVYADDTLVLYTDGLTDAPKGEAVPVDEIAEVIRRHRSGDVDLLADTIRQLKRSRRPSGSSDDTAVLVIRFGAAPHPQLEIAAAGDATSAPAVADVDSGAVLA